MSILKPTYMHSAMSSSLGAVLALALVCGPTVALGSSKQDTVLRCASFTRLMVQTSKNDISAAQLQQINDQSVSLISILKARSTGGSDVVARVDAVLVEISDEMAALPNNEDKEAGNAFLDSEAQQCRGLMNELGIR